MFTFSFALNVLCSKGSTVAVEWRCPTYKISTSTLIAAAIGGPGIYTTQQTQLRATLGGQEYVLMWTCLVLHG